MKQDNSLKTVQLTALCVIAFGALLIYSQFSIREGASSRLKRLQADTPDKKKVEEDLKASQDDVKTYSDELVHLEQGVPTNAYVATLLKELEALGIQKQLVVTGVRPALNTAAAAPPASGKDGAVKPVSKPYDELDIDITGRGNYASVMNTVEALQTFPKIVAVKTVSLQPKSDPANQKLNMLDATISIKAYVFKEGEAGVDNKVVLDTTKQVPVK